MAQITWFEDRYTNITVASGGMPGTTEAGAVSYGVCCLLPHIHAEARGREEAVSAVLPSFALSRRFRLSDLPADWSGSVRLVLTLPVRYRYTFRGRPLEPEAAPTREAAARPFAQRVEVDGELTARVYEVSPEGQHLTLAGSMQTVSLRRAGARQGVWVAPRRGAQSVWEAQWAEDGAEDLYTVNGDQEVLPAPHALEVELTLPSASAGGTFGVELVLHSLALFVRQSGFQGVVRGEVDTLPEGLQIDLQVVDAG